MTKTSFDVFEPYRKLTHQLIARCSILGTIFDHGTLKGNTAEKIIRDLLKNFFPSQIRVETGQVVSVNGVRSPQTDVIVFSDMSGSVVGIDEDGVCLVRSEAVRCVVEIKKSLIGTTIEEFQQQSKKLAESMVSGERKTSWIHWTIAIQSLISSEKILQKLKATCDFSCSTGGLLVLDAPMTNEELKAILDEFELGFEDEENGKMLKVSDKNLLELSQSLKAANSLFFIRDRSEQYRLEGDRTDALLRFMVHLEETTLKSPSCGSMWLRDFAVAQERKKSEARDATET